MKLSIKKNSIVIVSFVLMCISVFFLRWYKNSNLIAYIGFISSITLFFLFREKPKYSYKKIFLLSFYLIYIVINLLATTKHTYLFEDLFVHTILPFSVLFFFTNFFKSEEIIQKVENPIFYFFNLYYLVNTYITMKQITTKGFMVRNFTTNSYYLDQIDGLLGNNGTHRLCIFFLVCLYMNLINMNSNNKTKNKISKIMFIFVLITSLYISAFNDNRMYYLLLVIFLLPILMIKIKAKKSLNKKRIIKTIILGISIISIFGITYKYNNKFRNFLKVDIYEKNIQKTINRANNTRTDSNKKGEERIELTIYAIKNGDGFFIGKGLGSIISYGDPSMPKHFGLCESTTRIYTGGILYLLLLVSIYTTYLSDYQKTKRPMLTIYIFITVTIFALYARIFTIYDETFLISILYLFLTKYIDINIRRKTNEK